MIFKNTKFSNHLPLKFNIQLFAEDENNGDEGNQELSPRTYSVEEYNKLKNSFDKTSSELAEAKKQLKNKMTDEEKQKEAQEEFNKQYEQLKAENLQMKISKELALGGYEEKEIEVITKHIVSNDYTNLCKELTKIRKNTVEKITNEVKSQLQKTNLLPNGNVENNGIDSDVQSYIDSKKTQSKNRARDYYVPQTTK